MSKKLEFISSVRFIPSSLSSIADSRPEEIDKVELKHGHDNKKCKMCGIKSNHSESCLEY